MNQEKFQTLVFGAEGNKSINANKLVSEMYSINLLDRGIN